MPATQVEFYNLDKSFKRVVYLGKREHVLRVSHEASAQISLSLPDQAPRS